MSPQDRLAGGEAGALVPLKSPRCMPAQLTATSSWDRPVSPRVPPQDAADAGSGARGPTAELPWLCTSAASKVLPGSSPGTHRGADGGSQRDAYGDEGGEVVQCGTDGGAQRSAECHADPDRAGARTLRLGHGGLQRGPRRPVRPIWGFP